MLPKNFRGACGVMVIVEGKDHSDLSSNLDGAVSLKKGSTEYPTEWDLYKRKFE